MRPRSLARVSPGPSPTAWAFRSVLRSFPVGPRPSRGLRRGRRLHQGSGSQQNTRQRNSGRGAVSGESLADGIGRSRGSDGALLATAEASCSGSAATADRAAPAPAPTVGRQLFSSWSRWTSPDFAPPRIPRSRCGDWPARRARPSMLRSRLVCRGWVLASLGALSALDSRAQALLARSPFWPERVLATLRDPGSPLLHGARCLPSARSIVSCRRVI